MPATTPKDRITALFAAGSTPLPDKPGPGTTCLPKPRLGAKAEEASVIVRSCEIPGDLREPSEPVQVKPPQTQRDYWSPSEDSDEYEALFKKKPSMKDPEPTFKRDANSSMRDRSKHHSRVEPRMPNSYAPNSNDRDSVNRSNNTPKKDLHIERLPAFNLHGHKLVGHFCPLVLAAKFPYKYMNDENDRVSRHFFANDKFYNRTWDLYYLHPPYALGYKPAIFIPREQFQKLINEINAAFKCNAIAPKYPFTVSFFDNGAPLPQSLGTSQTRDEAVILQSKVPQCGSTHGEVPMNASPALRQAYADFATMCRDVSASTKNKKGKQRREHDRLVHTRDWYWQLRRTQGYLGLRPKAGKVEAPDPNMSWAESEEFRIKQEKKFGVILDPLDLNKPMPYEFDKEVVLISVDVEAYERAHNLITEVGISILDTLDIADLPPGTGGKNWIDQIRSRHFRIKGREHLVNREFCPGHPDGFVFGVSEFIDLDEAPAIVDSCFEWPFCVQFKHPSVVDPWRRPPRATPMSSNVTQRRAGVNITGSFNDSSGIEDGDEFSQPPSATLGQRGPKNRTIVLVGHDTHSDLDFLKVLGSNIFSISQATNPMAANILASIIESLDTAPLYRILQQEKNNRNLGSILSDLGIQAYFLHNGGNDARYTLEALVGMAIKARSLDDGARARSGKDLEPKGAGSGWEASFAPEPEFKVQVEGGRGLSLQRHVSADPDANSDTAMSIRSGRPPIRGHAARELSSTDNSNFTDSGGGWTARDDAAWAAGTLGESSSWNDEGESTRHGSGSGDSLQKGREARCEEAGR